MDYDHVIIGGGSAGYAAARTAANLGLKTLVVEGGDEVGGLCILRGCMPSKTLIESANRMQTLRHAEEFGLSTRDIGFDGDAIIARKRRLIGEFADFRKEQLETGRFDFLRGNASFVEKNTLRITLPDGGEKLLTSATFLISTGSNISSPVVPGLAEAGFLTSDDLLDRAKIPASAIVLGAGPVALELTHYLASLGCRITVIQRSGQLLKGTDAEAAAVVASSFRRRGMEIFTDTKLLRVERNGESRRVFFEHEGIEKSAEAEIIFNALGRKPRIAGLGLEAADVLLAEDHIQTNPHQQTSAPHIFAAGDCCGPYEIVHIAITQGELAARNASRVLKNDPHFESIDYRLKLYVIFTEPQVACVGISEEEAASQGREILSASYPFNDHGKSLIMNETEGFVKLTVDKTSREILGACVVGPHASDLIHEIVVAMRFNATAGQFASIPHYHPTLSEIWTYPAEELAESTV